MDMCARRKYYFVRFVLQISSAISNYAFVGPRKMQETRCTSFSLTLVVLLGNWLITNVNARIDDTGSCTGPLLPLQTRRTSTGRVINYRRK